MFVGRRDNVNTTKDWRGNDVKEVVALSDTALGVEGGMGRVLLGHPNPCCNHNVRKSEGEGLLINVSLVL